MARLRRLTINIPNELLHYRKGALLFRDAIAIEASLAEWRATADAEGNILLSDPFCRARLIDVCRPLIQSDGKLFFKLSYELAFKIFDDSDRERFSDFFTLSGFEIIDELDLVILNDRVVDRWSQELHSNNKSINRPEQGHLLRARTVKTQDKLLAVDADETAREPLAGKAALPASRSDNVPQQQAAETFGLSVEGNVDRMTRLGATGWAWMPSAPDDPVRVEAVLDGTVVGTTLADLMRPDLAKWGKGTGRYGFAMEFNDPLTHDKAPLMRVLGPEGQTVLPGAVKLISAEASAKPAAVPSASTDAQGNYGSSSPNVEGHIDSLTRLEATGWAWMASMPDAVVQVEAVLGDRMIGRATADQLRPDLLQWGKGTGRYGFKIAFDEPLTGDRAPVLRVLAAVGEALPGAGPLPPRTAGENVLRTRGTLTGLLRDHAHFTFAGPEFEEFDPAILKSAKADQESAQPLLLAFYLPQFHPIPENDRFWGKGFTEWRQLPKSISRFPEHYQPRIPRDMGFYNLCNLDALQAQAELARAAGVHAFAFYYYWFNRKRVLEKPLEMLLESNVDMPFLIIWANENWTRTWDGSESEVLLKQDYDQKDEDALLDDLSRHFLDKRYVRIRNRPLFIIYNPKNIPDACSTIARWRSIVKSRYDLDPLIFMAQTFGEREPKSYGLDGAIEFPPHKLSDKLPGRPTPDAYSRDFTGRVIAYDDLVDASLNEVDPDFPLIKTIVPGWDNDSRRPNRGLTLEALSPAKYQAWLYALILRAIDNPILDTPIVAINAWNEWAESAYLEPDVYFGAAFLNATARAYVSALSRQNFESSKNALAPGPSPAVSVILPNYNHAKYLPERIASIVGQSVPPDEIIFLDDCSSDDSINVANDILNASKIPFRIVKNKTNSGSVFRQWIKGLALAKNELIWIAETDDSADLRFLSQILPHFARDDVMACFGYIGCIDQAGAQRADLDQYFRGLRDFSWHSSKVVPAYEAFSHDFSIKNVIPNASGLVFRKPRLNGEELERLYQYRFAGDWYFYALVLRGGAIAYSRNARSLFRISQSSTSRSAFFTERHLAEHKMVVRDLWSQYGISDSVIDAHADELAVHFIGRSKEEIRDALRSPPLIVEKPRPIRICVAAHSFAVGGGEVLPTELANELKSRGHHITYLVMERSGPGCRSIRERLRSDIPVLYWDDVAENLERFIVGYGIELINSHNVSVEYQLFLRRLPVLVPYVASLHGGYETVPDLLTEEFVSYLNKTVTAWLSLADKNKEILVDSGVSAANFQKSFNAIPRFQGEWINRNEFRADYDIPEDSFVLVLCSRAIEEKGWQTAIDVAVLVTKSSERHIHVVLIGDGPAVAKLKSENFHRNCVTFLGHADNPIRYFRCFDLGIFPSTFKGETFPLFLVECFQAGLPVVSTDIGEIPHMMGDNKEFRPGAIAAHNGGAEQICREMADFILKLLADEGMYVRMCANARQASQRFGMNVLADLYESKFYNLVRRPPELA